jgi:hypothetical protein
VSLVTEDGADEGVKALLETPAGAEG